MVQDTFGLVSPLPQQYMCAVRNGVDVKDVRCSIRDKLTDSVDR